MRGFLRFIRNDGGWIALVAIGGGITFTVYGRLYDNHNVLWAGGMLLGLFVMWLIDEVAAYLDHLDKEHQE